MWRGTVNHGLNFVDLSVYVRRTRQILSTSSKTSMNFSAPLRAIGIGMNNVDMKDVTGYDSAKQLMAVAAAGGHNILFIGAPGAGKTMLARRIPSILPALNPSEQAEVDQVYAARSTALPGRPFRAPHHTVSVRAMQEEVRLAAHGVLFLDEAPEFSKVVLEAVNGEIARAKDRAPLIVLAANPCPCGFRGHPQRDCLCSSKALDVHQQRLNFIARKFACLVVRLDASPTRVKGTSMSSEEIRVHVVEVQARLRASVAAWCPDPNESVVVQKVARTLTVFDNRFCVREEDLDEARTLLCRAPININVTI